MAKAINFTYDDTDYTLEFTRKTVEQMERANFNIREVRNKPMTTLPTLFTGAFLAHHRWIKQDVIDKIYGKLTDKQDLMEKLIDMYTESVETLFEEPVESEKNVKWEANF